MGWKVGLNLGSESAEASDRIWEKNLEGSGVMNAAIEEKTTLIAVKSKH